MQSDEFFAMVCGSTTIIVLPLLLVFLYMTLSRYWRYRETMMMAERGLMRQVSNGNGNGSSNRNTLRWGLITTFLGLALCLGMWPIGFLVGTPLGLGPWLLLGLIPMFFGMALLVLYGIGRWEEGGVAQPVGEEAVPPSKYSGE